MRVAGVRHASDKRGQNDLIDVLYVACNRRAFTEHTLDMLIDNTAWPLVNKLWLWDDGSTDGTDSVLEAAALNRQPGQPVIEFVRTKYGSPVEVMNDLVSRTNSGRFVKIDNDIVVPPGYLEALCQAWNDSPVPLDALGMEGGRIMIPPDGFDGVYTTEEARWIGGVGMIRTGALGERPQLFANGRFGWTEFQRDYGLSCAWISPDLAVTELSRIPFEPWSSHSMEYRHAEIERPWPKYHERWGYWYWSWWAPDEGDNGEDDV